LARITGQERPEIVNMDFKPKNILHLIGSDFYGGPEKQIIEHLRILDKEKYSGHIASFLEGEKNSNEVLEVAKELGIKSHSIRMKNPLDFRALSQLKNMIDDLKIDLLCTHGYKSAVLGALIGKLKNRPVISFSHGYTTENFKVAIYEWLEKRAIERVNGVIAVSHAQKLKLDKYRVKYKKCWVVHNATTVTNLNSDDKSFRPEICKEFSIPEDKIIAVIAGRLSPEKAHNILLDAVHLLGDKLDNTVILICGDGQCRTDLEQQAARLNIRDKCIFTGFRKDLDRFYNAMDFMILSSLTEGLPLVVLEAMAIAKPVISTSVGGVPEVIKDGVNGFLVKPGNAQELANGISRILDEFENFEEIGNKAYSLIKKDFSFKIHAEKIQSIYDEVLL
jgi:glycosyltransferase involved in cell wall biosynthesis